MPQKTISEPVFDKQRRRWRVTIPATLSDTGQRCRSWHPTRQAARDYISEVTGESSDDPQNDKPAIIPPLLAMKAEEARSILEPHGLDLVEAARILSRALKTLSGVATLEEAVKSYRKAHDTKSASKKLNKAIELYLDARCKFPSIHRISLLIVAELTPCDLVQNTA